jgi:hypothetical protein
LRVGMTTPTDGPFMTLLYEVCSAWMG